jgi:hypothetical protein
MNRIPGSAMNRREMCALVGGSSVFKNKCKASRKSGSYFINNGRGLGGGRHDKWSFCL